MLSSVPYRSYAFRVERITPIASAREGKTTFRGRGLAFVHGSHIVMKVCPACSQWNAPKAADMGVCGWCAYVPLHEDIEPAAPVTQYDTAIR